MVRFLRLAGVTMGAVIWAAACSGTSADAPYPSSSNDASEADRLAEVTTSEDGGQHEDSAATLDFDAGSDAANTDRGDTDATDANAARDAVPDDADTDGDDTGATDATFDFDAGSDAVDGATIHPPITPVFRVELRIHVNQSGLPREELAVVLDEINFIWWSQAAICFEIQTSRDDVSLTSGFDLWFVPVLTEFPDSNGIIYGDHEIYSRDYPILEPAQNPVRHPAARTASHELGHGLGLVHYNGQADSPESLMASRQSGYILHDFEISIAREQARLKGLSDTTPGTCNAPRID